MPFARIAAPLQQVFFPAFSQMNDDRERMADIWIRATRLVGVISIPALVGLVIVAPDFVQVVLGSRWSDATAVIQILAVVGIVQSLHTLNGEVLMALGRRARSSGTRCSGPPADRRRRRASGCRGPSSASPPATRSRRC